MSDRLVVEKSARQRKVEAGFYYLMPPVLAAASLFLIGPGLWQIPIILSGFVVLSIAGNVLAIKTGGELITPAERWRRSLARTLAAPLWNLLFWMFVFYLILFCSFILPMSGPKEWRSFYEFMSPVILIGSALASALCALYIRSSARKIDTVGPAPELQSPWPWLRSFAPFRLITIVGVVAGYLGGKNFHDPYNIFILLGGFWSGQIVESVIRSRRGSNAPVLWTNFGFLAALATGVVQAAIPLALFFLFIGAIYDNGFNITAFVFSAAGFIGGLLYVLILWAVAKFNSVKAQAQ